MNAEVTADLFDRAGTLRSAYAAVDWAATALGPVESWSESLRYAVEVALGTRFPVTLFWGPEFVLVYNEAYVEMIADKHPAALGAPAREVFPEAWDAIGPMMQSVYDGGGATWVEDELVPLYRSGFLEECYFTFSYSPIRGREGVVEGVMDIATETTTQVVVSRRLSMLTRLGFELREVDDLERLRRTTVDVLATDGSDLRLVDLWIPGATADPVPDVPAIPPGQDLVRVGEGREVWLRLPTSDRSEQGGLLGVRLSDQLSVDASYLGFLRLLASAVARTMDRILAVGAERTVSATLQRSLLTTPVQVAGLDVAVRYLPATELAQIGGDWYDSFLLPDRSLTLVVGDVAGHDLGAASAMAQLRNLTRGVAHSADGRPAAVLRGLDSAMRGLGVDVVATAVLLQVGAADELGRRTVHWSNAGHPPPALVGPDGTVRLLETKPDLLLGLDPDATRVDHTVELEPGTSLVLYTDGLVERRGAALHDGLGWLVDSLTGRVGLTADELCTHLLAEVQGATEDDVAMLVLRVDPPTADRPTGE